MKLADDVGVLPDLTIYHVEQTHHPITSPYMMGGTITRTLRVQIYRAHRLGDSTPIPLSPELIEAIEADRRKRGLPLFN